METLLNGRSSFAANILQNKRKTFAVVLFLLQSALLFSQSVGGGYYHSLILCTDSTVWATGRNNFGQLGDGTNNNTVVPIKVSGLTNIVAVASGGDFSLALKADGTVWSWGVNKNGQLGNNDTAMSNIPLQVQNLSNIYSISAGENYSLALKNDGTIWGWGKNNSGQLGDGTMEDKLSPVQIPTLSNVVAISAAKSHSLALKGDGTLWTWGANSYGQLGDGSENGSLTPIQILTINEVKSIATGMYHSLAMKNDGTVWAWGYNGHGVFGNGTTISSNIPVQTTGLNTSKILAAGQSFSMSIENDSTVKTWGNNKYGQIGNGTTTTQNSPVQANNISQVIMMESGIYHSLAVKQDGTVWTWGFNNFGQLGDSTTTNKTSPVQMKAGCPVAKINPVCGVAAAFSASQTTICSGETVSFSNISTGAGNYSWDENGTGFSTDADPQHVFSTPGNFTIRLIANPGICADTSEISITVDPTPDATITATSPLCYADAPAQLSAATSGGTWSGTGISSSGLFDPSLSGSGTHTITYSVTVGNCSGSDTEDFLVNSNPDATITATSPLCSAGAPVQLSAATSGGIWSGTGISSSGLFDPSITGSGTHTATYSVTVGICSSTDTKDILVNENPDATITAISPLCAGDAPVQMNAATPSGIWGGTGISSSGLFDPSIAGSGTHTVTYSVTVGSCSNSDSEDILVNANPDATITAISPLCSADSPVQMNAATSGGTWSGTGISSSGLFDPSVAGSGTHTVTYSVTVGSCSNADFEDILVNANPDATISAISPLCSADSPVQMNAATSGGTWSGTGISSSGLFDPSFAGSGTHTVTYSVTVGSCSGSDTEDVLVNPSPQATFSVSQNGNIVSFTNSSTDASSYDWDFGDGTNSVLENPQHTYLSDGTYDIILVVQNSCGSSSFTYQVTISGLGIKSANSEKNMTIYPNPNPGIFTLVLPDNISKSEFEVRIFNMLGEELQYFNQNDYNDSQTFDLTHHGSGIYFLKVVSESKTLTRRVVVF